MIPSATVVTYNVKYNTDEDEGNGSDPCDKREDEIEDPREYENYT